MILFDFHAPSVKSFNRKRRHIGIRIFIRIIYPINGYPDSKLSVLSIPSRNTLHRTVSLQQPGFLVYHYSCVTVNAVSSVIAVLCSRQCLCCLRPWYCFGCLLRLVFDQCLSVCLWQLVCLKTSFACSSLTSSVDRQCLMYVCPAAWLPACAVVVDNIVVSRVEYIRICLMHSWW